MTRRILVAIVAGLLSVCPGAVPTVGAVPAESGPATRFEWRALPALPQPLAGQAAGVSHGALLVIGGTNFPIPPSAGGTKVWFAEVHLFDRAAGEWRTPFRLAHPLGYAAAATIDNRVIVAGGSDGSRYYTDVFSLEWSGGAIRQQALPPLPRPLAMAGAAAIGHTLYVIGGQPRPDASETFRTVWALDLAAAAPAWRALAPLPGAGRVLPVVTARDGRLFVFSGAELRRTREGLAEPEGSAGPLVRRYLTDAYVWTPNAPGTSGAGWRQLADVPHPIVAAPAAAMGASHIMVFGGDTGADAERVAELKDAHPGFSRDLLTYHTITDTWRTLDTLPASLVTTPAVSWGDDIVVPGGEDRPGHRAAAVLAVRLAPTGRAFGAIDYSVLGLSFVPLLLIGRHFSHQNRSVEDYFLGGRRVPWWAAGVSIHASRLSAIAFLAIPATAYATDWVFCLAALSVLLVAPLVVSCYLPFLRGLAATSAYEYLEHRFDIIIRLCGSLLFIVMQIARMAIVLCLPALMLAAVSGLDASVSILLMGVLCTVYTLAGGMRAVIWTEIVQVAVVIGAATFSLAIIVLSLDRGIPDMIRVASAAGKLHMFNWSWRAATTSVWVIVMAHGLASLVPYTADQSVVQRYFTTSDEKQAARAVWAGALLTVATLLLFFSVGTALFLFYRAHPQALHPEALHPAVATDATFAWFIARQMPAGLAGLAVAGIFAASMAGLSASINSITTAIAIDLRTRFNPGVFDASRLRFARWVTGVTGAVGTASALLVASWNLGSAWDTFLQAVGLFGGGLAGLFALGIFTTRASARGALIGLVTSAIVLAFVRRAGAVHVFFYAGIGIATCMTVGYLASVILPPHAKSVAGLTIHTRKRS